MVTDNHIRVDLLIGHFIDSDTKVLPIGISFAGNYYQEKTRSILNIRHSISLIYEERDKKFNSNDKIEYIALKQKRHIFNIFKIVKHILGLSWRGGKGKTILFYNLSIYSLIFYIYYVFITKARVVVILADAGFIIEKNITSRMISKALSYANGILTLREIQELRGYKSKIEIMPGIITKNLPSIESKKIPNTVFLSGSLGVTTGLILALEYFSNQSQLKLFITGVPYSMSNLEFERILEKYKSDNINFLGVLDYKEYIIALTSIEFGLSLRNPKEIEHQYNFPSKILEYMSHGSIVISSLKYPELIDDIYFSSEYSVEGLSDCFEKILKISINDRKILSKNARNFVKSQFSEEVLKIKIDNLFKC
jgi:glycosyltransferase involved in cell wall biosynthesis